MRNGFDVDTLATMCEKLGMDIGLARQDVIVELSAVGSDIVWAFERIVEHEETPERFKRFSDEEITQYSLFIKEEVDKAYSAIEYRRELERKERNIAEDEYKQSLPPLRDAIRNIDALIYQVVEKSIKARRGNGSTTTQLWENFKKSVGA